LKFISIFAARSLLNQAEKVLHKRKLTGNCVKITNCRATVSNKKVFALIGPLLQMGRTAKMLQVRRPAFTVLTMLSRTEAKSGTPPSFLNFYFREDVSAPF
jgi:hypothetical protein